MSALRHGSLEGQVGVNRFPRGSVKPTASERILMAVEPDTNGGCWLWSELTNKAGYGRVCWSGRFLLAHRLSYETFVGPIPDGLLICHKCDTPACVNPDHLFVGTYSDNMADKVTKGRVNRGRSPVGSQCAWAKLDEAKVRQIRQRRAEPHRALAEEFGVSVITLENVISRRRWKHVD